MKESYIKYIPDFILRIAIHIVCKMRLRQCQLGGVQEQFSKQQHWLTSLHKSPIAFETEAANEQHYEVPSDFYKLCLGSHLKYSSAIWTDGIKTLEEAEEKMLDLTCKRAGLSNQQNILELGCGWGSLTLFMAEKFPGSKITSVSNSHSQREYIMNCAKQRGLKNIEVISCDMNTFKSSPQYYDRIVSVEMFEHMRNWPILMERMKRWLKDDGLCFVHIFTNRNYGYAYEVQDASDWMSKYFFTGGQMPSTHQFAYCQDHLKLEQQWAVSGVHYQKTSNAWLKNMDKNKKQILKLFQEFYGKDSELWYMRWRIFFMSCAELFGYNQGNEWFISHYTFSKRRYESEVQIRARA